MNTDMQLKKIHELELQIALEIRRICEKNQIPYFLTAGTLLGAVRHGGFIPWDDDMDIGMLRKDYVRFLEACKTDLGDAYYLQTWDTDPDYPFSFAKIRLNGTHFVEQFSRKSTSHDGIFVDVFPFDSVPEREAERHLQAKRYFLCKRLLWMKKGLGKNMLQQSEKQAIRYHMFHAFSMLLPYSYMKHYFQRIQQKFNDQETKLVVTDGSYKYEKESIPRAWTEDLEEISFEGEKFTSYREKIAYLTHFYGDYMQLPPVEKRNRHERFEVDFGPYT